MKTTNALDLCGSVEKQLGSYLKKQGLAVLRCDNFHVEFANTHTKLVFEQYEETALRFWFFDLAASDNKPFNLPIFLDAILGSPNSLSLRPAPDGVSVNDQFEADLVYLASMVQTHMGRPIQGDFSWSKTYRERAAYLEKLDHFLAELSKKRDKRRLPIQVKKRIADPTWESDARALYKEINGKDFE